MKKGLTINVMTVVLVCILNVILAHTILTDAYKNNVSAQAPNGTNQTASQSTSQPEITVSEKIIVPVQKTMVTVNKTTLSVSPQVIQLINETQNPNK